MNDFEYGSDKPEITEKILTTIIGGLADAHDSQVSEPVRAKAKQLIVDGFTLTQGWDFCAEIANLTSIQVSPFVLALTNLSRYYRKPSAD